VAIRLARKEDDFAETPFIDVMLVLRPALESAAAGNHDERIFLRADKAVSNGDMMLQSDEHH
jgi:biopolymer transport protein ExbD